MVAIVFILLLTSVSVFADSVGAVADYYADDTCWLLAQHNNCPNSDPTLKTMAHAREIKCQTNLNLRNCSQFITRFKDDKYAGHLMHCDIQDICAIENGSNLAEGCRQYGIELKNDAISIGQKIEACLTDLSCMKSILLIPGYKVAWLAAKDVAGLPKALENGVDKLYHFTCLDPTMQAKLYCYAAVQAGVAVVTTPAGKLAGRVALAYLNKGALAGVAEAEVDVVANETADAAAHSADRSGKKPKAKTSAENPALSADDAAHYEAYYKSVTSAIERNMQENSAEVLEAIDRKDSQITFLRSLGYTIERRGAQLYLKVPPFKDQIKRLNGRIDELVKSGAVPKGQDLRPAKIYSSIDPVTKMSEVHAVPFDAPIPAGFEPYDGILTDEQYAKIVASGYMPIGSAIIGGNGISVAAHDLAHFFGVVEHPDFMTSFRQTYGNLVKVYAGPPMERAEETALKSRMQEIAEGYEHLPPTKTAAFAQAMGQHGIHLPEQGFVTLDDVKDQLHGKSDAEVRAILRRLASTKYVDSVGGFSNDMITRRHKIRMKPELASEYQSPSAIVDYALRNNSLPPAAVRAQVARAITAIRNSAELGPATAIREASQPVQRGSALFHYYCKSGVWNGSHEVYKAFCVGKL